MRETRRTYTPSFDFRHQVRTCVSHIWFQAPGADVCIPHFGFRPQVRTVNSPGKQQQDFCSKPTEKKRKRMYSRDGESVAKIFLASTFICSFFLEIPYLHIKFEFTVKFFPFLLEIKKKIFKATSRVGTCKTLLLDAPKWTVVTSISRSRFGATYI